MPLLPGTRIGPYTVAAKLGAGGMGEVYRAKDVTLNRDVALKVLPPEFASQVDRVARFEREAQLLASLNHPHIAQIYGVEHDGSTRALVMEYVDGMTLADVLAKRPSRRLPVEEALTFARQIAGALDAAHEKGVIHRDLKPGNVMVTPEGSVKLVDFGLGKSVAEEPAADMANSPTMTAMQTQAGMLMGTAAYMSPEQAKGRVTDKRSDVWAFGCVLFEMLAGKRAFEGEDVTETLAAVVRGEPEWSALPANTPPHVERLVRRCLTRDRQARLRDIGDARHELEATSTVHGAVATDATRPRWVVHAAWAAAVLLAAIAAGVAGARLRAPANPPETRLDIATPPTLDPIPLAISPDGRHVVFSALSAGQPMLWLRSLDSAAARPLPGTDRALTPFWSPDGKMLAFVSGGKLKRLNLANGTTDTLTDAVTVTGGGSWSAEGVILYRRATPASLMRIPAAGGESTEAVALAPGVGAHSMPQFLPDGRRFLFHGSAASGGVGGVYLASLDNEPPVQLVASRTAGTFIHPGWVAYISQDLSLVARRLDLETRSLVGDPVKISQSIMVAGGSARIALSTAADGTIAYRADAAPRRQLTWFDRNGAQLGTLGSEDTALMSPVLSPDGKRVVVGRMIDGNSDIWIIDGLRTRRLTSHPSMDIFPTWSSNGSRIVFRSFAAGRDGLYVRSPDGEGADTLLAGPVKAGLVNAPTSWSTDGRFILADVSGPGSGSDIWTIPIGGTDAPGPLVATPFAERLGMFSPNGQWVAYQSNESGRAEIYVRPFQGAGGQFQISNGGGAQPQWRHDGGELYWIAPDAKLMAASISVKGQSIDSGAPRALFQTRIFLGGVEQPNRGQYAVAADGRFLISTLLDDPNVPITIVQHWQPK